MSQSDGNNYSKSVNQSNNQPNVKQNRQNHQINSNNSNSNNNAKNSNNSNANGENNHNSPSKSQFDREFYKINKNNICVSINTLSWISAGVERTLPPNILGRVIFEHGHAHVAFGLGNNGQQQLRIRQPKLYVSCDMRKVKVVVKQWYLSHNGSLPFDINFTQNEKANLQAKMQKQMTGKKHSMQNNNSNDKSNDAPPRKRQKQQASPNNHENENANSNSNNNNSNSVSNDMSNDSDDISISTGDSKQFKFTAKRVGILVETALNYDFWTEYWGRNVFYSKLGCILVKCIEKDSTFGNTTAKKIEQKLCTLYTIITYCSC